MSKKIKNSSDLENQQTAKEHKENTGNRHGSICSCIERIKITDKRDRLVVTLASDVPMPDLPHGGRKKQDRIESSNWKQNYERTKAKRKYSVEQMCRKAFVAGKCSLITLTFDPSRFAEGNVKNYLFTHNEFHKFIKRIQRKYDNFQYFATYARQENGNIHYHMMCNLSPDNAKSVDVRALWGNGSVVVNFINQQKHFENSIRYLAKTMKEYALEKRYKRAYLTSIKKDKSYSSTRADDEQEFNKLLDKVTSEHIDGTREVPEKIFSYLAKPIVDENTGEVEFECLFDTELTPELEEQGYRVVNSVRNCFVIPKKPDEITEAPTEAIPKAKKVSKRKKRHKKD